MLPTHASDDKTFTKELLIGCLQQYNYILNIDQVTLTVINVSLNTKILNVNSVASYRIAIFEILQDNHVSLYNTPGKNWFLPIASESKFKFLFIVVYIIFFVHIMFRNKKKKYTLRL